LRTVLATRDVKENVLKAGFNWKPYALRAHCNMNMILAESKGKI
jgi:hypothetical protein